MQKAVSEVLVERRVVTKPKTGKVDVTPLEFSVDEMITLRSNASKSLSSVGKRFVDIALSGIGLIGLGLLLPLIALGIKLSSRGPIFFLQARTGLDGKKFDCWKFRTMHNLEYETSNGTPDVTKKGDRRVFRFGRFLRRTNIDEIPQMINVLKGEMSLVGPRPYSVQESDYWTEIIPGFSLRNLVKPGITGWAQVTGYRGGNLCANHMNSRLRRDLKYIERYSIMLDAKIIAKTILQMIHFKTNAH